MPRKNHRTWSAEDKLRILEEARQADVIACVRTWSKPASGTLDTHSRVSNSKPIDSQGTKSPLQWHCIWLCL